jgi:hypothetical protein
MCPAGDKAATHLCLLGFLCKWTFCLVPLKHCGTDSHWRVGALCLQGRPVPTCKQVLSPAQSRTESPPGVTKDIPSLSAGSSCPHRDVDWLSTAGATSQSRAGQTSSSPPPGWVATHWAVVAADVFHVGGLWSAARPVLPLKCPMSSPQVVLVLPLISVGPLGCRKHGILPALVQHPDCVLLTCR